MLGPASQSLHFSIATLQCKSLLMANCITNKTRNLVTSMGLSFTSKPMIQRLSDCLTSTPHVLSRFLQNFPQGDDPLPVWSSPVQVFLSTKWVCVKPEIPQQTFKPLFGCYLWLIWRKHDQAHNTAVGTQMSLNASYSSTINMYIDMLWTLVLTFSSKINLLPKSIPDTVFIFKFIVRDH